MLQGSIDNLELLVELPIKAAEDTHFRVRWAAINAIEEFSNDLKPEFQLQYYQQVLPALSKALNFSMHPCIQVHGLPLPSHITSLCKEYYECRIPFFFFKS